MASPDIQLQHAREFLARIGARQYRPLADLLSESFTHRFFPASLNGMGMPFRNAQEFVDHVKEVGQTIESFNVSGAFKRLAWGTLGDVTTGSLWKKI